MDGTPPVGVDEQSTRHEAPRGGRFVLRADSIRPYNCGDRAAPADNVCKCSAGKKSPLRLRGGATHIQRSNNYQAMQTA